jgi:hypothetical protein
MPWREVPYASLPPGLIFRERQLDHWLPAPEIKPLKEGKCCGPSQGIPVVNCDKFAQMNNKTSTNT